MKFAVCIPILNGGTIYLELLKALDAQDVKPSDFIVIDSGSNDGSDEVSKRHGARVFKIPSPQFNHGGTRSQALSYLSGDIEVVIYLTQDAIPANLDTFSKIVSRFVNTEIGACYGRQLPHKNATPAETFSRLHNYTNQSRRNDLRKNANLKFSDTNFSNSFAAYRVSALRAVGGFSNQVILGEDVIANIELLQAGWVTEYVGEAAVYHSHNYTVHQEFRRYFDIGVFHSRNSIMFTPFGTPSGRGKEYALSEFRDMSQYGVFAQIHSVMRSGAKFLGYKLGLMEHRIPVFLKRHLSMHRRFWATRQND